MLAETYSSRFEHLWRLPFFFGGVLALIGYMLRRHLPPEQIESESRNAPTSEEKRKHPSARWPALQAFREIPRTMIVAMLFTCGYGISNYLTMVFLPTFGREFANVAESSALRANMAGQALALVIVPLAGWISDRWIRRRTFLACAFLLEAALAWELFVAVMKAGVAGLWLAQLLFAGILAVVMGTAPAMLAEQFPRGYRVSGHALVLNVGIGIAGGSAPMVAVALIRGTGSNLAPAAYLMTACVVSGVAALLLSDRSREPL